MDDDSINDYDEEELNNIIILSDENGEDVEFEFLDLIDYEQEEYIVLLSSDDSEMVILKVLPSANPDRDTDNYCPVEDAYTLSAIFELFQLRNSDRFEF